MQESSDDDSTKPVHLTLSNHKKTHKIQQVDSGIEYDQLSPPPSTSSSTIFNQKAFNNANNNRNKNKHLLFPSATKTSMVDDTSQSTLVQRLQSPMTKTITKNKTPLKTLTTSYWNRLKQTWLRSLVLGLFLLFILFWIYFLRLDTCSRSTMIRTVCQKILSVEHEGLPTI